MLVRLVVMLDPLATPTPGGQTPTSNSGLFTGMMDGITKSPESTAIRGVLTLLVVVIALIGGRWLASVAGRGAPCGAGGPRAPGPPPSARAHRDNTPTHD